MQNLGGVLQEERLKRGIKQADLARMAHVSRQTLSGYENGAIQQIPHDVACRLINALGSARLQYAYCSACPANLMTTPWLEVDSHPVVVQHKVIEELEEAIEALKEVRLTNKHYADDLTADDKRKMERALEQLWDCIPALQMWFGLVPDYGYSLQQQKDNHINKLRSKRYIGYRATQLAKTRARVAF